MSNTDPKAKERVVVRHESHSRAVRRIAIACAPLALLATVLALFQRQAPSSGGTSDPLNLPRAAANRGGGGVPGRREDAPRTAALPPSRSPSSEIVIDGVDVDKTEICRGEEVVVSIRARTTDHTDEYLSYSGLERLDLQGPRFSLRPTETIGVDALKLLVRGRGGASAVASVPPVLVNDCESRFTLTVALERRAAAQDRAWLAATVMPPQRAASGEAFQPVEFVWDFGDGATLVTQSERTEHSYEARPQTSAYSYFFVTVTARDAAHRELRASRSLRFVNLGFYPLAREHRVMVFAGIQPTTERSRHETIWLYHGAPFPVGLDRVVVSDVGSDAAGNETLSKVGEYEPAALLGFANLPAGRSVIVRDLSTLYPKEPGQVRLVEVHGRNPPGKIVNGAFTLIAPDEAGSEPHALETSAVQNEHAALEASSFGEPDYAASALQNRPEP